MTAAPADFIRVWLDNPRLGCGYREFLVLRVGRKWVRLLDPATAIASDVGIAELRHAAALPCSRTRVRRRIARTLRDRTGWGLPVSAGDARLAIRLLKAAAQPTGIAA